MGTQGVDAPTQAVVKYQPFVIGQLKAGTPKEHIVERLVRMGVDQPTALQVVETIATQRAIMTEDQGSAAPSLLGSLIGGLAAAIIGGTIWGFLTKVTGYEIGFMAWGLGLLCGLGVVALSGGRRGLPYQVIAVLTAILGIVIARYMTIFYLAKPGVPPFSGPFMLFFLSHLKMAFEPMDILWFFLAIMTARRIPGHRKPNTKT